MNELIKYFESLEARIATLEAELASVEAELDELKSRPIPEPQVIEKEVIKEMVVERSAISHQPSEEPEIPEPIVESEPIVDPGASSQSNGESGLRLEGQAEEPVVEEVSSPKAALYGKAVDDIRQAISLGDRFLYQRELFGQNAELMQRTLNELNELHSFDEAMLYIAEHFQWDTESSTYQQFIVTLHRRFG